MILVSAGVDVRDWNAVLGEIRQHFDPHFDFVLIPKVPLDTLDFTSFKMELGSKMILDATRKHSPRLTESDGGDQRPEGKGRRVKEVKSMDRRIVDARVEQDCLLLVKVKSGGRAVVEKLVKKEELQHLKIIGAVSDDVDIADRENSIWGLFTRFDCERDVVFTEQRLIGISPVYKGLMGIDATWKAGYPEPLRMTDVIVRRVERRWKEYWS
jgi:4-hydroxy-3-polyprenylbenzoate decarboxylase